MSGEKGDIPVMRDLIMQENGNKSQSESQKRIQLRESLTNHFISLGYKIDTSKETTLRLDFPDKQTIRQVFYCFDFDNKSSGPEKQKVNEYLDPKTHDFKNHLYLFHAWKG